MTTAAFICASGMVTSVGFNAPASCAAIRVGLANTSDTRFKVTGEWLQGAQVPFETGFRGAERWLQLVVPAIDECMGASRPGTPEDTAVWLCLPDVSRPGSASHVAREVTSTAFRRLADPRRVSRHSHAFDGGKLDVIEALAHAQRLLARGLARYVVAAGVDSFFDSRLIAAYESQRRLKTAKNPDGFIPGEAGAAVLVALEPHGACLRMLGVGRGVEEATLLSERPLRANGMSRAIRTAIAASPGGFGAVDYRLADVSGEQYGFKQAALALARAMRSSKKEFPLWTPADCVGEVGAATVPLVLGVVLAACRKRYAPGPGALCHFADDSGNCAALVVREEGVANGN